MNEQNEAIVWHEKWMCIMCMRMDKPNDLKKRAAMLIVGAKEMTKSASNPFRNLLIEIWRRCNGISTQVYIFCMCV